VHFDNSIALEVTIMSKQDEPDDSASSEEEAELRAFRDIVSALDRGNVDDLAAALSRTDDPAPRRPGAMDGRKKVGSDGDSSFFGARPLIGSQQAKRWRFWNVFRFMTRNDSASQDTAPH
jgi:hypothetical protein